MEKHRYAFLILHYYTIEDTNKCIESIFKNCKNEDINIIIVDNASPNKTGEVLKKKYQLNDKIHVILNKKNLGFANGNNLGFEYAKTKLKPDFIIMCNNDTYLIQENFIDLVEREYEKSKFAVLGPLILLPNNKINPIIEKLPNVKELKKQLLDFRIDIITNYIYINKLYKAIRRFLKKTLIKFRLKKPIKLESNSNLRREDVVLHGSFLIFSQKYINKFDGIDTRTFLYREEELLALRLKDNNLKSVYNPEIKIFHNEDGATNAINKSNRNKEIFVCKNQIKSTKILLLEMEKKK